MTYPFRILFLSFVKPFYKENAAAFVFVFTIMFYIVGVVDGAGVFAYHRSLAIGMLKSGTFLSMVFLGWLFYARKSAVFVSSKFDQPNYSFIQVFNCCSKSKQFRLFFLVELLLLMPVLLYALFVISVGLQQHSYLPVIFIVAFLVLLSMLQGFYHAYAINHKNTAAASLPNETTHLIRIAGNYFIILIKYVLKKEIFIWAATKIFTCGILYLVARNNTSTSYDLSFPFLFFNFGILAQGVIVHRVREFEKFYLSFYPVLPIPLLNRLLQYALFYFILLMPEFVTAWHLVPVQLKYIDALHFSLSAFSLLLLLNSITFVEDFNMKAYLKILLLIFCVQYVFLMMLGLSFLSLSFLTIAITVFVKGFYKFEVRTN